MSIRGRIIRKMGFEPMSHRPPLAPRYWFYSSAAYLIPVVAQIGFPNDPALTDTVDKMTRVQTAPVTSWAVGLTTLDLKGASSRDN